MLESSKALFIIEETFVDGEIEGVVPCVVEIKVKNPISEEAQKTSEAVTAVSGVLGLVSGPAAAQAVRLSLAISPCILNNYDNSTLPWVLHPTQISDPYYESEYAGCIIGNSAIVIGFGIVCYSTVLFLTKVMPSRFEDYMATSRVLKFPSVPLFVFLFLYQGTILSVFKLLFYPGSGGHYVISIPGLVLCIAVPVQLQRIIRKEVEDNMMARYRIDEVILPKWLTFIVGPGEWVSTTKKNDFVQKYSTMIRPFKETRSWYVVFEFLSMALLAAAMTLRTTTWVECGHIRIFGASVNFIFFFVEFLKRPHVRGRDDFIDPAMFLLQAMGLLLCGIGYYNENPNFWTFDTSVPFFQACSVLLMVKLLLDLICVIWVLFLFEDPNKKGSWRRSSRRQRLQNAELEEEEKGIANAELDVFEADSPNHEEVALFEASVKGGSERSLSMKDEVLETPLLQNDESESFAFEPSNPSYSFAAYVFTFH